MSKIETGFSLVSGGAGWAIPPASVIRLPRVKGEVDPARLAVLIEDLDASVQAHGMILLEFLTARGWQREELEFLLADGLRGLAQRRAEASPSAGIVAAAIAGFVLAVPYAVWLALEFIADHSIPLV